MIWGLVWIIGIYGAAVAVLHILYASHQKREPQTTYFALVTHNNGTQIEWYLRSLIFFSWLRGRHISVTVFDEASTDDTVAVVRQFAAGRGNIKVEVAEGSLESFLEAHQGDAVIVHRVMTVGKDERLPVLQW
ncbi:hypothetical protein [Gorillibacterium sp. sgz5001074]|uniref:hypothetical protein n=1 Tax=Gorillibacterium sp. sgz5001074 TaxID=3446695 RepID=UPI003F66442F